MFRSIAGRPLVVAALLIAPVRPASAGTIQMVVSSQVSMSSSTLHVRLDIRNQGTEAAFRIAPRIEFRGSRVDGEITDTLDPSALHVAHFNVSAHNIEQHPGSWPMPVRVRYHDRNGHRFEALHVARLRIGNEGPEASEPAPGLELSGGRMTQATDLAAYFDPQSLRSQVRVTFVAPTGISVTPRDVLVVPRTASKVATWVHVEVDGATAGSVLPIFAVAEYEAGGRHETALASSILEIVADTAPPSSNRVVRAALVALVATWMLILARVQWRRRRNAS
jgi:hypothetical protein